MSTIHIRGTLPAKNWFQFLLVQTPYAVANAMLAALLAAIILILSTTGCGSSSKPAPPKPGTVGHSWMSAEQAYRSGDYKRAHEQLARLVGAKSEYAERAKLLSLVVSGGVATGYRELADAYENGGRLNKAAVFDYRKRMSDARRSANQATMLYVESLHEFIGTNKDAKITFPFDFPTGKAGEPLQLTKLNKGTTLQPADYDVLERAMLERAVVRLASEVAGAPGDIEKAKAQFKEVSRESLLKAMARSLYENADLYGPRKLDEPRRLHILCKEALAALAALPEGTDKKQLDAKIRDLMKKHPLKEA